MPVFKLMSTKKRYSDEEKADFCELAQQIGIGRARRELGYPSYPAAIAWMNQRGIEPNVDKAMQTIKRYHQHYEMEDLMVVFDDAIGAAEEMIMNAKTADDLNKIAGALNKIVQTRNLIEGKATAINEKRETTQQDLEIMDLLNAEKAKNAAFERNEAEI